MDGPDDKTDETPAERVRRRLIEEARKRGAVIDEDGKPWKQPPEPEKPPA